MNWSRLAWSLLDKLKLLGLNGASQKAEKVLEGIRSAGGLVQEMTGDGTPMTWFCGVKVN